MATQRESGKPGELGEVFDESKELERRLNRAVARVQDAEKELRLARNEERAARGARARYEVRRESTGG